MSAHRMAVGGLEVELRPSGALWVDAARALVVADLHLEKGSAYAQRGQMLPPFDTRETLARLAREVEACSPSIVVLLGDTLHDRKAESRISEDDAKQVAAMARGRTLLWIVGNHDADGPTALPGETAQEIGLFGLKFRHEPRDGADHAWAAGHLHPCARIAGRGGSVRRRCFVTDGERIVLPAFGAYAGGLNVRDRAFARLFAREPIAVALGARSYAVRWEKLRGD